MQSATLKKNTHQQEAALASLRKKYGSSLVVKTSSDYEVIPTGFPSLDHELLGGWVKGKFHELFGPPQSGKTVLAYSSISHAQKSGLICVYIDADGKYSPEVAAANGVDIDSLEVFAPSTAEEAFNITLHAVQSGVGFVVIDSVASLVPKKIYADASIGAFGDLDLDQNDMELARVSSLALRFIRPLLQAKEATVLLCNQSRSRVVDVFGGAQNKDGGASVIDRIMTTATPGGEYIKSVSSSRVELKLASSPQVKHISAQSHVSVVQSQLTRPGAVDSVLLPMRLSRLLVEVDVLTLAVRTGVVEVDKGSYRFADKVLGGNYNAALKTLTVNASVLEQMLCEVKK
ncbi:hypothetical protein A6E01_20325 (plasmid) [Vibrio breoganii]|uniref:Protein RecA n=2 Tax=Vibrio TaxID=662 RepID=A0AAN0XZI0_9VIBR|nr:hypothetical protein [Vibrio breoganii]ANO35561.1 hypothetical protein A6E01_20325 [Vibrio breoganii]PML15824.1 hypothetical protein BCT84_07420 [Vibrio breoganii]